MPTPATSSPATYCVRGFYYRLLILSDYNAQHYTPVDRIRVGRQRSAILFIYMSWRKNLQKLPHLQLKELAGLCAGAALLLLVAVFLSGGAKNLVTISGIAPESQTASDFSCDIFNNCTAGSATPYSNITASPNPVAQGSIVTVNWQSNGEGQSIFGGTGGPKIWDSDGNVWLNRGYVGFTSNYRYGQFQATITHTVTYYICGWYQILYQNCTIPASQVTVTVTAPPPPPPPPPSCSLSPASQTITSPSDAGPFTYSFTNSPTSAYYTVDGGAQNAVSLSGGSGPIPGLSVGSHTIALTASNSAGSCNSYSTVNVTASCIPSAICSGGNLVDSCTGGLVQDCGGSGCSGNACVSAPPPPDDPCPDYIETPWQAEGLLLYAGSTRKITQQGYNVCVTNYSGSTYFIGANSGDEIQGFIDNAGNLGVDVY
jgi:hypothetical protein